MADDNSQEKTEQPTPKKKREAREKGQVARSKELATMAVLMASAGGMILMGDSLISGITGMMHDAFKASRTDIMDVKSIPRMLEQAFTGAITNLLPFLMLVMAVALLSPMLLSGWSFSTKAMAFKWDKLNPIKGIKKIFAVRGLMELVKALAKFVLVLFIAILLLWNNVDSLLSLGAMDVRQALNDAGSILGWSFLALSCGMILIALVDVPFQLWDHTRQLKMSHKELKDEYKETDGSPELKRRVREVQMQMAQRRMMEDVPLADVVVTNPTHYAVALRYDQENMKAPTVVAKGKGMIAQQIRNIAAANDVPILSAPPLSRALYHSTELKQEIPEGLFRAVAQVLAYVYQLRKRRYRKATDELTLSDLPIPDEYKRDK